MVDVEEVKSRLEMYKLHDGLDSMFIGQYVQDVEKLLNVIDQLATMRLPNVGAGNVLKSLLDTGIEKPVLLEDLFETLGDRWSAVRALRENGVVDLYCVDTLFGEFSYTGSSVKEALENAVKAKTKESDRE